MFNTYNTEYTSEYIDSLPQEVKEQYIDDINNIPYIKRFLDVNRPRAKDLPRDSDGKIIIDITKPHTLENTDYFRPSAIHYKKYGCYTKLRPNANPNSEYGKWIREEIRRCWEGYIRKEDGEWITGDMYFFLNYCPIQLIKKNEQGMAIRTLDFPRFWDGHYYKFHYLNQCRQNGHHAMELASRGKGKSLSAAAMLAKRFILGESKHVNKKVQCVATASERKYIQGAYQLLDMFQFYIDFCANNTEFPRQRITSSLQNLAWTMGYIDSETMTRRGTENSVVGITSKDDESKLRGSRGVLYLLEESGCHLKGTECYKADKSIEKVENIKVGDFLLGPDMNPREVLKVFHGISPMYKITLSNGDFQVVTENHPVYVKVRTWGKTVKEEFKTFTCRELLKRNYTKGHYILKQPTVYEHKNENIPVKIEKKKYKGRNKHRNKINRLEYSFKIEPYGVGEYYGFLLDKDHLFLLKDHTIVHNTFPRLLNLYQVLRPSVEDGNSVFGLIYGYGTSGDNDSDFSSMQELMYNPKGYNIQEIDNVYDKEGQGRKYFTYFFPGYLNRADCYDEDGNSDVSKALLEILLDRYKVKYNSTDINAITKRIAEIPITPQEAILRTHGNIFPVTELNNRLNEIDNNPNFYDDTYVGTLVSNSKGGIEFSITTEDKPIREFPTKDNKVKGALEIYEMPQKIQDKIPTDRYILSCLPKGEKVNTSNGLKKVEDITVNDKLINKEGKEVSIINCQQYYNNREIYNIKLSSVFDSTKFTYNHPIYCATPKVHYHNANMCRKHNLKQKYYTYDFNFKQAQDVKVGDYVKAPILYQETKNISHYWQDFSRADKRIENPLDKEDFWYLIGVILGDGWAASDGYNIGIVFNKQEKYLINRCKEIVSKIFNRKFSKVRENKSTITYQFSCSYFNNFFKQYFGIGAENKFIFNDFKYIGEGLKKALILGYIDTDGCVKNSGVEVVSISKRLLNDIQDILFSLQIISSVHLLRKKEVHYIVDRYSLCKDTYTLHIGKIGTSKMYDWNLNSMKIPMFKNYTTIDHDRKYSFIKDGYLYLRVMNITKENYKGIVYNFACDTHTFMCNYIPTHNCDNYENDEAQSMSLGSIFVLDLWTDRIVAEYTGRPQFADDLNELCRKLCIFYNGKVMVENNKKNTFAYFSRMNSLHLMADTPEYLKNKQLIKSIGFGNASKGITATVPIKNFAFGLIRDWLLKPITITKEEGTETVQYTVPNLHFIKNRALIKELILYNPDINVDRIMSLAQLMLYREEKMILYQGDPTKSKKTVDSNYLGNDPFFSNNYRQ